MQVRKADRLRGQRPMSRDWPPSKSSYGSAGRYASTNGSAQQDAPGETLMSVNTPHAIDRWHDMMARGTTDGLHDLLHPDCVFWSPVVHTPQRGRDITFLYLSAAGQVFDADFHYVRLRDGDNAMLEFQEPWMACTSTGLT